MKKLTFLFAMLMMCFATMAQGPGGSTDTIPDGAAYILSNGSTITLTGETISTTSSDYNVVQVTSGNLTLDNCTITKSGDTNSNDGDATSFYGINSAVYAKGLNATSVITMNGGTITTQAIGSNAVFAWRGATINVNDVTIHNYSNVSRGLHATYEGIINATNVNITTEGATSSTIATDRGGGTVTVTGGTATAQGMRSAVLYSTGTITANDLIGVSEQGEIADVEGDNGVIINNCSMTSGSSERGLMMLQSGSGDAQGENAYITVTSSSLTTTDSDAPLCEVPTKNVGTLTLTDVTLSVASGKLMYVDYNTQWSTHGGTGNLVLNTTQSSWVYEGTVDADSYSNVTVTVGSNVIWKGMMDADNNALSSTVTVNSNGSWSLTGDSYVDVLVNNGTIYKCGYNLTYGSLSGNGTISEGEGVGENYLDEQMNDGRVYSIEGRCLGNEIPENYRGVYIQNGKKHMKTY
jgi:hypothetical protein